MTTRNQAQKKPRANRSRKIDLRANPADESVRRFTGTFDEMAAYVDRIRAEQEAAARAAAAPIVTHLDVYRVTREWDNADHAEQIRAATGSTSDPDFEEFVACCQRVRLRARARALAVKP